MHLSTIRGRRKRSIFFNCSGDETAGLRITRSSSLCISGIRYQPESLSRWLNWHEFVFACSQRGPRTDEDLLFLIFWTNFRKKMSSSYKYLANFSSFAIQLGNRCKYQINGYRGVFRIQSNSYAVFFFAKIVNGWKPLTVTVKKLHRRCSTGF